MSVNEWIPTTATELSRLVLENFQGEQKPFSPVGGRTSLCYGGAVSPELTSLVTSELNEVIDYPYRDMTMTVESGIRIDTLQAALAEKGQRLPIDIPQAGRATLGGAVASNTSGPSRFGHGTFRDYVIGISAVDGQGRLFSAGGQVVKNVAGYDLCKLLIGSMGTLATVTQVTLKLTPMPEYKQILIGAFDLTASLENVLNDLNRSQTRPVLMDVLNPKAVWQLGNEANIQLPNDANLLVLGFEGTERETKWQVQTAKDELRPHSPRDLFDLYAEQRDSFYEGLVEFQTASDDPLSFRASVPLSQVEPFLKLATQFSVAVQAHAASGVLYGHLPDRCTSAALAKEVITPLRAHAEARSGTLTVMNCDREWSQELDLWGKKSASWNLMSQVKQTLDPVGVMSPGRLF